MKRQYLVSIATALALGILLASAPAAEDVEILISKLGTRDNVTADSVMEKIK